MFEFTYRRISSHFFLYALMTAVSVLICIEPSAAFAEGTLGQTNIRLSGTVVALGCTVDPGDVDKPVILGDWATKQLKKTGDHTHSVAFTISLTGCTASGVTPAFTGKKDALDASLLALNDDDASSAQGVAVQIMDNTQKRIPMGDNAPRSLVDSNGDVALNFYANYVATGNNTVTPGTANADTEFTLTYD